MSSPAFDITRLDAMHSLRIAKKRNSAYLSALLGARPIDARAQMSWAVECAQVCERLAYIANLMVQTREHNLTVRALHEMEVRKGRKLTGDEMRSVKLDSAIALGRDKILKDAVGSNQMYFNWSQMYSGLAVALAKQLELGLVRYSNSPVPRGATTNLDHLIFPVTEL